MGSDGNPQAGQRVYIGREVKQRARGLEQCRAAAPSLGITELHLPRGRKAANFAHCNTIVPGGVICRPSLVNRDAGAGYWGAEDVSGRRPATGMEPARGWKWRGKADWRWRRRMGMVWDVTGPGFERS